MESISFWKLSSVDFAVLAAVDRGSCLCSSQPLLSRNAALRAAVQGGVSWTELPWNQTPTHHPKLYTWGFSSLEFKWLHISSLWMLQELKTPAKSPSGEGCNSCPLRRFWNPHFCLRLLWSHTSSSVLAPCHLLMRTTNDDRPWVRLLRSNSVLSLTAKHLLQRYLWSSWTHSPLLGSLKVVSVRPAFPSQNLQMLWTRKLLWDRICISLHFRFSWWKFLKELFLSLQSSAFIMISSHMFTIVLFLCLPSFPWWFQHLSITSCQ